MDGSLTSVINQIASGEVPLDADPAVRTVYDQLRAMAHNRLEDEQHVTLQTTDLVHEAYLKLFRPGGIWQNRGHFFGSASRAMEQLLIELAAKRRLRPVTGADLDAAAQPVPDPVRLSQALKELESLDRELAHIARLRFFAGISVELTAEIVQIPERTVKRRWAFARAWLLNRARGRESERP